MNSRPRQRHLYACAGGMVDAGREGRAGEASCATRHECGAAAEASGMGWMKKWQGGKLTEGHGAH